jgi:hypothetical protein
MRSGLSRRPPQQDGGTRIRWRGCNASSCVPRETMSTTSTGMIMSLSSPCGAQSRAVVPTWAAYRNKSDRDFLQSRPEALAISCTELEQGGPPDSCIGLAVPD